MASLSVVFAVSAWSKFRSRAAFDAFADSLRPLLPARFAGPAGTALTIAETAVVLALASSVAAALFRWGMAGPCGLVALAAALLLLVVLTLGVVLAVRRGSGATCACFGAKQRPLSRRHIVRNATLLVAAAAGLAGVARPGIEPLVAIVAIVAGLVAATVVVTLDDLVDLFQPVHPTPVPTGDHR
jgi:hypothetical protein